MNDGVSGDRFGELEESYKEYTVYDQHYEKIGRVDDLFVDESDQPEYIGVKTGFLGMKSTLIPVEMARVNDRRKLVEIAADKDVIEHAPTFDTNEEITPSYENEVHSYFGLEPQRSSSTGGYGDYYHSDAPPETEREPYEDERLEQQVDTEYGERAEPDTSTGSQPSDEPRREVPLDPSRSRTSSRESLDIPLDDPERRDTASRDTASRDTASVEPSRSNESRETFADKGEAGGMRVHKRVRRTS